MQPSEPDVRVLGVLALGFAVLSAGLAVTYFFSPLAYLAAVLALALGLLSRGDERSRLLGNIAIGLTVVAIAVATGILIWT